jgi:hypothetical protein
MDAIVFGLVCGAAFGTVAVLLMLPMKFPDRKTALSAAFASRFAIGFIVPAAHFPVPAAVGGAIVGALVSLPDAIITKAYVPVLVIGTMGGALIGYLSPGH